MSEPKHGDPTDSAELSISELARAAEVSTATVHFYVKEGLLPPPRRLNRTRAAWSQHHLRLLRVISRLKGGGLPLAVIARMVAPAVEDESRLRQLEDIGYYQPLPAPRGSADRRPIEPFTPVTRAELLARAGVEGELLDLALRIGVVRPLKAGRYDSRDLWALQQLQTLRDDGLSLDDLGALAELAALSTRLAPLMLAQARRHAPALQRRELRFRELAEPWQHLLAYLIERAMTEHLPDWREQILVPRDGDGA